MFGRAMTRAFSAPSARTASVKPGSAREPQHFGANRGELVDRKVGQRGLEGRELGAGEALERVGLRLVVQGGADADQIVGFGALRQTRDLAWQRLGVGLGPPDFLRDRLRVVGQRDIGVLRGVGFRHFLRAVAQAHDSGGGPLDQGFGQRKVGVAVPVGGDRRGEIIVELLRDVARQLQMLLLVVADRNMRRPIDENVGGHQHWIVVKSDRRVLPVLARFLLELGHAVEPAESRDAVEPPGEFSMLGDPALVEDDIGLRVDAAGKKGRRHLARRAGKLLRLVRQRHRVQVDEPLDRAKIVAEVQIACRLNAGKHALGKLRHLRPVRAGIIGAALMATPAGARKGGERAGLAPGSHSPTPRSTMISAANRSRALRNSSSLSPSGTLRRAVARNICTPVNGSPSRPLMNSSMLTPSPVSACVTSRTMPGRSLPTISSVTTRPGFSASPAAPRSIETRRREGAAFPSADWRGMRLSSGTLTSTPPANLPASRTERLSSQVAPQSATLSEMALTSPGLSSPTKVRTSDVMTGAPRGSPPSLSQDEPAQIGVRGEVADMTLDEIGVDANGFAGPVGGGEAHLVEHALHHRLQPTRANVLDRAVDLGGEAGDRRHRVIGKLELEAFGLHQRHILLYQARLGVGEDAFEIVLGQRIELDPDLQAAL